MTSAVCPAVTNVPKSTSSISNVPSNGAYTTVSCKLFSAKRICASIASKAARFCAATLACVSSVWRAMASSFANV